MAMSLCHMAMSRGEIDVVGMAADCMPMRSLKWQLNASSSRPLRVYPDAYVLIEPHHLRQDRSRPGDIYAIGNGLHIKNVVTDVGITSVLKQSCLFNASKGADYVLRTLEAVKFRKDSRSLAEDLSRPPPPAAWFPLPSTT